MRSTMRLCLGLFAVSVVAAASAKDIYVSPSGDDSSAGNSAAAPLRTIAAASSCAAAGDTVHLGAGQYGQPVVPVASGTAGAPITYSGPAKP